MKFIIFLLLLIASFSSQAQGSSNYYYDYETRIMNANPLSEEMKGVVKEVQIKKTFTKEKKNKSVQKQYDENGLVTFYEVNDRNGQLKVKNEAKYNAKGNLVEYKSYSTKGIQRERINNYDERLRLTESLIKTKKGKVQSRSTWAYDIGGCATQSKRFKKQGTKLHRVWDYTFYDECDRKKTTLSNNSGKVLKIWSYDCKKEGEQLTKKKNETQICKWDESDGKYLTRVFQNFNEKGKIRKTVQKYTLKDTLILESKTYNADGRLLNTWTYDKSFVRLTSYTSFNKKGEARYHQESTYKNEQIQSSSISRKGKQKSKKLYEYSDKNWLSKVRSFDNKGNQYKTEEFQYVL